MGLALALIAVPVGAIVALITLRPARRIGDLIGPPQGCCGRPLRRVFWGGAGLLHSSDAPEMVCHVAALGQVQHDQLVAEDVLDDGQTSNGDV
jgi:hypothetical protein